MPLFFYLYFLLVLKLSKNSALTTKAIASISCITLPKIYKRGEKNTVLD